MTRRATPFRQALALVWLLAATTVSAKPPDADDARSYAFRAPIQVVPGAPIQRLMLPAQVLLGSRRGDLGDVRVFDAEGRALPIALSDDSDRAAGTRGDLILKANPIVGVVGSLKLTGVSLMIGEDQRARVVTLDGKVDDTKPSTRVLGALLDVRAITSPAASLRLDADAPAGQPVTFIVEQSRDLQFWSPLATKVIFRPAGAAAAFMAEAIDLGSADLKDSYLRITWGASTPLVAPVVVRGATLTTQSPADGPTRVKVDLTGATLVNPRLITFALPFATRLDSIALEPAADGAVVPVGVFGRNSSDQPWTSLGGGTVSRIAMGGTPRFGPPVELHDHGYRLIKIEADERSPGFSAPPRISLYLQRVQLVFALGGKPPFKIAAGLASAPDAYLPPAAIIGSASPGADAALPVATGPASVTTLASAPAEGGGGAKTMNMALWSILLLGTCALSGMVWILIRKRPGP